MNKKSGRKNGFESERTVKNTELSYTKNDKMRILSEGIQNELEFSAVCDREGIDEKLFYDWCVDFLKTDHEKAIKLNKPKELLTEMNHIQIENILLKYLIKNLGLKNGALKSRLRTAV